MKEKEIKAEAAETQKEISAEEASRILADLQMQLDEAKRQVESYKDSYLRARADYDNLKKRADREAQDMIRLGKSDFMLKVLDVVDDLERAMASDAGYEALKSGLALTIKKLGSVAKSEGLEPIDAVGKPFDPALHEAVSTSEEDVDCETVLQELRKGYTYCGSTLRPSIVRVSVPKKG
ncbi:MAG TPA: nucleotide exchange factor GrpE [Bacillota bacterium]|nr:nucleotide exchange factor GrpE [Bacillota bacterium]HOA16222.1 nucleotide exchange factor GrpE [Bacillota bacterium]HOG53573.1 nucleotide exchange factor GrpE [Bacillota bacterium]